MNTETRNAYQLAHLADCASPDSEDSAGAVFLGSVADSVADYLGYTSTEDMDANDMAWEIADGAVPVYTHQVWQTFVDLAAYQEDPSELGADASDMEQAAKVALYMIAERLASALIAEAIEADEEE